MKVIFLDCDGVLNYKGCRARSPKGYKGISDVKLKLLKEIVDATAARIVLISTWKNGWEKDRSRITDEDTLYLLRKFRKHGLSVFDKTGENAWMNRGQGIFSWLSFHKDVTEWVVLDDEFFSDYEEYGIMERLVKIDNPGENGGGLQPEHVAKAIEVLNSANFNKE